MKNKKIILGLGTITALGAMSMGFVACKKTEAGEDALKKRLDLVEKHLNKDGALFKTEVDDFFKETTSGSTKTDPKAVGELKTNAKVSDLIAKVKEIKGFSDKYDIISKDSDKEGTEVDGRKLTGTEHSLTIMKKNEEKDTTKLKVEVKFTFTIATS